MTENIGQTQNAPKQVADVLIIHSVVRHNSISGAGRLEGEWAVRSGGERAVPDLASINLSSTDLASADLSTAIETNPGGSVGGSGSDLSNASAGVFAENSAANPIGTAHQDTHKSVGVLLVRATWNLDKPNSWQMPGGHVEPGETPDMAAQREVDEELGVGAVRVGRKITQVIEDDGTIAHVFEGHLNFAKQPQADGVEIAEVEWFATSVAAEKMNPLSAHLFRAAMEKVQGAT